MKDFSLLLLAALMAAGAPANAEPREGSRADHREDRRDRNEDIRDRNEDVRDRRENRADRNEDVRDRREDRRDRAEDIRDRREDIADRREDRRDHVFDREDIADRREDIRDAREDRRDRAEDVRDRREDRRDRAEDVRDRRENRADRREDVRDNREDRRENVRERIVQERRQRVQELRRINQPRYAQIRVNLRNNRFQVRERFRVFLPNVVIRRDVTVIRSPQRWRPRYNVWIANTRRPTFVNFSINWFMPMPVVYTQVVVGAPVRVWDYSQVEVVAANLERLTQKMFDDVEFASRGAANQRYRENLLERIARLNDAADNFTDSVYDGSDFGDSLYDLFNLEEQLTETENKLNNYRFGYAGSDEMRALRYYVNELLFVYRNRY